MTILFYLTLFIYLGSGSKDDTCFKVGGDGSFKFRKDGTTGLGATSIFRDGLVG